MMDSPKKLGYRMPAEYEPHHGTLMIWPTRPGSWPFQGKAAKAALAALPSKGQEPGRVGQIMRVPWWGSYSAGIR